MHKLRVERSTLAKVRPLIEGGHYLGKVHNRGRFAFALMDGQKLVGAALFGQPARETVSVSLWKCENDEDRKHAAAATLELTRFYTIAKEELPHNAGTWFLARAVRMLRQGDSPGKRDLFGKVPTSDIEMLVAFSDPAAKHHGGLYQAAGWLYTGASATDHYHYEDKDGNRVAKQTPWYYAKRNGLRPGERPADGERRVADEKGWTKVKDQPKHRYVKPLTRDAEQSLRLKLPVLSYPKPRPCD